MLYKTAGWKLCRPKLVFDDSAQVLKGYILLQYFELTHIVIKCSLRVYDLWISLKSWDGVSLISAWILYISNNLNCIRIDISTQSQLLKKWRIVIGKSRQSQTKTAFAIPFDRVLIVRSIYSIARALSSLLHLCFTRGIASAVLVPRGRVDLYDARYDYSAVPPLVRRFLASGTNVNSRQSGIGTQRGRKNDARRAFYKCIYHIFGRAACRTGKIKAWKDDLYGFYCMWSGGIVSGTLSRKSIECVR